MMLTRCPGCTTTFRLTPEQIKVRHGQVRCGRCQHVFDAIEFLVEAPLAAAFIEVEPAANITVAMPDESNVAPTETATVPPGAEVTETAPGSEEGSDGAETGAAVTTESSIPEEQEAPITAAVLASETEVASASRILLETPAQPSPLSVAYLNATEAARTPRWPWLIASILALFVLIVQAMIGFRVDIVTKYPESRPILEQLCTHFNCTIGLPSNPELVSIEASDLHPGKNAGLELTATLKNRAAHAQAWPHLELTLTDGADKPIVRKIITPQNFLPLEQNPEEGFPANGEFAVQLALDPGSLPAAGYRLYLFYP